MKKDAFYFSHDSNARHDPKIMAMMKTYKSAGYGNYWIIIETLREQQDFKLPCKKYVYDAFAMQMQCEPEEVQEYINDCIKEYELFATDEDFFWSESLLKRMELKNAKSNKNRESANIRWKQAKNIQPDNGDNANAIQTHSERNAVVLRNDAKERKGKESKLKETKEKEYIYNFWNELGIIQHKNMNGSQTAIKSALKDYTQQEITDAMKNYSDILKSDNHFYSYKWTLKQFLARGLDNFLTVNNPKENYKNSDSRNGRGSKAISQYPTGNSTKDFTEKTDENLQRAAAISRKNTYIT